MKNKNQLTLKQILKEFDTKYVFEREFSVDYCEGLNMLKHDIKDFITQSIKDALEACRVDKSKEEIDLPYPKEEVYITDWSDYVAGGTAGYNKCTTQYDENVKSFLGEEKV